jgi:hypothetical protein
MALRDKLRDLSKGLEGTPASEIIDDWNRVVNELLDTISGFLAGYEQENLVSIARYRVEIIEEGFCSYDTQKLDIKSGKHVIGVQPVGRFVAGADGRVDMRRYSRPDMRVMLLYMARQDGTMRWSVWLSDDDLLSSVIDIHQQRARSLALSVLQNGATLTKEVLEVALEYLLS